MTTPIRNIPNDRQPVGREPTNRADTDWYGYWQELGRAMRELQAGPIAPSYTVATLPSPIALAGATIYVSDESGGAILAYSDGTDWRRVTDRAIVS